MYVVRHGNWDYGPVPKFCNAKETQETAVCDHGPTIT